MNSKVYKWCAVPQCKNTSIKTPNKVFVDVPNKKTIRDTWLKLARRNPNDVVSNSPPYFCEDYFDDTEMMYRLGRAAMENGQYGDALKKFVDVLKLYNETLSPPYRSYYDCVQDLRRCMLAMGNYSIV